MPGAVRPGERRAFARLGMALFLAALAMLFLAALVGYVLVRLRADDAIPVRLPAVFWWSTATLVASGLALVAAVRAAARERGRRLRLALLASAALAAAFVALQVPGMAQLLEEHRAASGDRPSHQGLVLSIVFLHAMHVLGGLVPLGVVVARGLAGRYDHERHLPIRLLATYWHFLEAVWLVTLAVFVAF